MTKEKLMEMGLTEEQANKVMEGLDGAFVTKTRFNEVNTELTTAKNTIKERDTQLETLKKSTGDVATLNQTINDLQTVNADQKKAHEAEMKKVRVNNAVEKALADAKAINPATVTPLLKDFLEKADLSDDGTIKGLADEIGKLTKGEGTSFLFKADNSNEPGISGAAPAGTVTTTPDPKLQGYQTRLAEARKNGDTVTAIKIKQEAAAEGVTIL